MSTKSAIFLFSSLLLIITSSPAFLAPITKDVATRKYLLTVYLNTPPRPTNLLLDLSASVSRVECPCRHQTTVFSFGSCPSCPDDARTLRKPPLTGRPMIDTLSMPVTDGANPGKLASFPRFMFSCDERTSLKGLVKGAAGFAGLGRSDLSIPAQLSNFTSEKLVFALCMSGSPSAPGVSFFGSSGSYYFLPEIELSKHLSYTPLLSNPTANSNEYFIGLTAIKVNGRAIDFDRTLLDIDEKGRGGTRLSTVARYTVLHY